MNRFAGAAAPRSMTRRRLRLLALGATAALLVTAAIGIPFPGGAVPTDRVHVVDLSRSCGADPTRLVDALAARLLPGDPDDRVAIVGFGASALTLAAPRPADDLEPALDAARAGLASLAVGERGRSRVSAGVARALTLVNDPGRRLVVTLWGDLRYPAGTLERLRRMLPSTARLHVGGRLIDPDPDVRLGFAGAPSRVEPGVPAILRVRVHLQDDRSRTATISAGERAFAVRLRPGRSEVLAVTITPKEGERIVRVSISDPGGPDSDEFNDVVALPVVDRGKQRVLVIGEGAIDLPSDAYDVVRTSRPELPIRAPIIVLADQPATESFRATWSEFIRRHVTSFGAGLVVLGGPHAFRSGGYGGWELDAFLPLSSRAPRGRDVHVLLDRSGSMEQDDRLKRAVEALRHLAKGLAPTDRVQAWPFGVDPLPPVPAALAPPELFVAEALADLWRLVPTGGTRLAGSLDGPARAAAAAGDEREAILVVLSDLKDDRFDTLAQRKFRERVAGFSGGAVVLLLDPTPRTTGTARDVGLEVVPVRKLTPDVFLAQVEGDGWRAAPMDTRWVNPPAGVPAAAPIRGWNPVLRGDGATVLLQAVDGQPLLGHAWRGAGRVMALATDPSLEGWTAGLVRLMLGAVSPPDGADWSARTSDGGLLIRSAPGVVGPLSVRWPGVGGGTMERPLVEVGPGSWRADMVPTATGDLHVHGASGELLARPTLALPDDPEYLLPPLAVPGSVSAPDPSPPSRVRWPPGVLALALMAALILSRDG